MDISSIPSFRLTPPWQRLTIAEEEARRQEEEMQEAAENQPFVSDPPAIDMSASIQLGYLQDGDNNFEIDGGLALLCRPSFNLELNYSLSVEVLNSLDDPASDTGLGLRQDLGITVINTISENSKTNVGVRLAFTYIRNLMGSGPQDLVGLTTGLEFANYTPRFFLEYTWLSDLQGGELHQAAMGLRVPFKL